jgi:hypothetical protein
VGSFIVTSGLSTTIAGGAVAGSADGKGSAASFTSPTLLALVNETYGSSQLCIACNVCPAGQYRTCNATASACNPCPPGTTSAGAGATSCSACVAGTYSAAAGGMCAACPAGSFSSAAGALACANCSAGTYRATPTACANCSAGTYALAAATACSACAPLTVGNATFVPPGGANATACPYACRPGFTFNAGPVPACSSCPVGQWAAPAAATPPAGGRRAGGTAYCAAGAGLPAAGVRVLMVVADNRFLDVQSKLQATGAFAAVDVFDANAGTPALSALQGYTAVLCWSRDPFASPAGLGDVLAQYWDAGGAVVVAVDSNVESKLQGRFGTAANGYMLIEGSAEWEDPSDSLGVVLEPLSPLMADVTALSAFYSYRSKGAVINGGIVVAQWATGGRPLVVRGTRAGRPLVALNMYPLSRDLGFVTGYWIGDGAALMRNALLFSACAPYLATVASGCAACTNLPPNATFAGTGANATGCPYHCIAGYTASGPGCLPCPAGSWMPAVGGPCTPCLAGSYSGPAATACTSCTGGSYSLGNSTACATCASARPGPYTVFIGRGTSASCPFYCRAGSYVVNRSACMPCVNGTYSALGATACAACSGQTWSAGGATACTTCSSLQVPVSSCRFSPLCFV